MSPITRITRDVTPNHDGSDVLVYSATGNYLGRIVFEKGTSRLEQPPGMAPYRTWPLKKKYRAR